MQYEKVRAEVLLDVIGDGREIAYRCGKVRPIARIYITSPWTEKQISAFGASRDTDRDAKGALRSLPVFALAG